MNKASLITLAVAAALASGCTTLTPMDYTENAPKTAEKTVSKLSKLDSWNDSAVIEEGKSAVVLMTPFSIPEELGNKKITMELEPGATIKDVVAILGRLGFSVIVADADAAAKEFYLPRFEGKLSNLLSAITRATDVWFTWHDGTIMVSATEKIGVSVPQEEKFGESFGKGLESLGVKDKAVTWQAGMAVLEVSPSQFKKVTRYLERMTANAAIVSMQVAVVNVTLNQTAKYGIDWDQLQLSAVGGNLKDLQQWKSINASNSAAAGTAPIVTANTSTTVSTGTTGTTGTTTGSTTATTPDLSTLPATVANMVLSGSGLAGALYSKAFSFTGLINFLQNYGEAETKQNVVLKTVTGNKVEFKSLTQIPYVEEVGVTTTDTTTTTAAIGSTKTAKADDGITVELTPTYDAAANTVTIDLKLSIKAVVAFNELSAGNQIGKLTQPTTADRSFTDTLRMRPGQTVMVGGLTYDSISSNRGGPVFLQQTSLESQSLTVNRQTMFIVVRPTVLKLGQMVKEQGDVSGEATQDFMPKAVQVKETTVAAEVTTAEKEPGKKAIAKNRKTVPPAAGAALPVPPSPHPSSIPPLPTASSLPAPVATPGNAGAK
jgi:hypothetical protein